MTTATIVIQADFGGGFVDITGDVRGVSPLRMRHGIMGNGPKDRIASPGSMSFALDNSAVNSGGLLGYYSPDHANIRSGFELGIPIRLKISYSGTDYYKFRGDVVSINPVAGQSGSRYTSVVATDYIDKLMRQKIFKVLVQAGQRDDQIITTLVAQMPTAPVATSYSIGSETYVFALNDVKDESTSIYNAILRCMHSGLGYFFVAGDTSGGETLTYQKRHDRIGLSSQATLTNAMVNLRTSRPIERVWNKIKMITMPARLDADATTVLYNLAKDIEIQPGETVTITARYRDPDGEATRVSGISIIKVMVADTHYKMSSNVDDGGNDLNADIAVVITEGGNNAELALTNNGSSLGHVNLLQVTGRGLYLYAPVELIFEDAASQSAYGERALVYKLPYQDNINVGTDFGQKFLATYKDPNTFISACDFIANTSDALMLAALSVEIGELVTITEEVTGIDTKFIVNAQELSITADGFIRCKWVLENEDVSVYWVLEDGSLGQLDSTTVLGV